MRHLKIQIIGYKNVADPRHNIELIGTNTPPWHQDPQAETILRVEIDKQTWDQMFDLYESHIRGFRNPTIQDAWDQYIMMLHLCGEADFAGHKKII